MKTIILENGRKISISNAAYLGYENTNKTWIDAITEYYYLFRRIDDTQVQAPMALKSLNSKVIITACFSFDLIFDLNENYVIKYYNEFGTAPTYEKMQLAIDDAIFYINS